MKNVLLLLTIATSITSYSQADTLFTAKFKSFTDAGKEHYLAAEVGKPAKAVLFIESINAFYPITKTQFIVKFSAMINDPTELAKLKDPIGLIQCMSQVYIDYNTCHSWYWNQGYYPGNQPCEHGALNNLAVCMYQYL